MKIYLVGGSIRNAFLNLPNTDKDWVVVGGTPKILLKKNYKQVGKGFPVFLHPITHEEYALARKERKSGYGHSDFNLNYSPNVTLEEDLMRRDLTINAIAQDLNGNFIDPYNGFKDLKNCVLKHISSSFKDDPLRVLRVARFAAYLSHLGFYIDKSTMKLMKSIVLSKEILFLTKDRIWKETEKALKTHSPHVFFKVLNECLALSILFPEIHNLLYNNKITSIMYSDVFFFKKNNALLALAKISKINKKIEIRLSCMFLMISFNLNENLKKNIENSKQQNFFFLVKHFCKRLNIPKKIKVLIFLTIKYNYFLLYVKQQSERSILKFLNNIDAWRKPKRIEKLKKIINTFATIFYKKKFFSHLPGKYLKEIYSITKSPPIKTILNTGVKGRKIKNSINKWRIQQLIKWKFINTIT